MRDNIPFLYYGKDIELRPYLDQSGAVISSTVKEMQNKVGRTSDIRSILLTGGGAALYEPDIRAAFPRVQIDVLDQPCYANVKGFFSAGETFHRRDQRKQGVIA